MNQLQLLKANLGITTDKRDAYLQFVLDSTQEELAKGKGIKFNTSEASSFLIDYAAWRFRNRGESVMPRNLEYRMRNLMIKTYGDENA